MNLRDMPKKQVAKYFYNVSLELTNKKWLARWMAAIACLESGYGRYYIDNNVVGYHYIDGMGWDYVIAEEGMTGNPRKYRKFNSIKDCFSSLLYLIEKSTATEEYIRSREFSVETEEGLRDRIYEFSKGYSPYAKKHGRNVFSIYKRIEKLCEDEAVEC